MASEMVERIGALLRTYDVAGKGHPSGEVEFFVLPVRDMGAALLAAESGTGFLGIGRYPEARKSCNEENARAVLRAMREPTGAMELAAGRDNWPSERLAAPSAWRAMIDAALDDAS